VCVREPVAFKNGFLSCGGKIIVSMEIFCEGSINEYEKCGIQSIPLANYWKHYKVVEKPFRKFANMGLVSGYAKDLRHMLSWIIDNNYKDDQLGLCNYMNTFPENVYADVNALIFHTSGFGFLACRANSKIQSQDGPTLAELLGHRGFFLHIAGIVNIKGQKFSYDKTYEILNIINNRRLYHQYQKTPLLWNQTFKFS
jgi:hypothetical protein